MINIQVGLGYGYFAFFIDYTTDYVVELFFLPFLSCVWSLWLYNKKYLSMVILSNTLKTSAHTFHQDV